MGVPGAFVWAVLAFVTNFIPNIGFVIGVIPPAFIGLLEGGPSLMLAVIAVYCVINFVIQSIIQPRYVGDAVGLTPTITMLSLVFWAWAPRPAGGPARGAAQPADARAAHRGGPRRPVGDCRSCLGPTGRPEPEPDPVAERRIRSAEPDPALTAARRSAA